MRELFEERGFLLERCTWELTLACNLRCGHCGSRAGEARPDELTHEEALKVIDDLGTLGCRHASLAGGEPTLRSDWPDLVRHFNHRGVRASLVSNGQTWSAELTREALAAGVHRMGFSLDGLERTHDCMRRSTTSHRKVLEAIDRCVEAGIQVVAITTLTRDNVPELERLHALLAEHGTEVWQVQLGVPQGNLSDNREDALGAEALLEIIPRLAAIKRRGDRPTLHLADNIGYFGEYEEELRGEGQRLPFWLGCRAGISVVGIESNGNVKGCLSLPSHLNQRDEFIEGNVRDRSLIEIWNDPAAFSYTRRFESKDLRGACTSCDFGEICRGGCTFTAVGHHGRPHEFSHCYYAVSRRNEAEGC